jgi:tripartite-type tricarboxylate transporter receptor subunit TctC
MQQHKSLLMLTGLLVIFTLVVASAPVYSADYPARDITVLVPWPAGGGTDMVTRSFLKNANKFFPVNVQIVNVTGGGGIVGLGKTAGARPDGYTLCMFEINTLQGYDVQGMTKYNLVNDFTLINRVGFGEAVLVVGKNSPFNTIQEFIAFAKSHPGELKISVGCGKGCAWHMPLELLMRSVGAELKYVYMQGGAPARTAAIGGHVDGATIGIMEASDFVKAGDLKMLAVFGESRNKHHPEVPTVGELGYPKIAMGVSWVLGGPNGIAKEKVDTLLKYTEKCFNDPEFRELLDKKVISVPDHFYGPEETKAYMMENEERIRKVLTALGLAKKK